MKNTIIAALFALAAGPAFAADPAVGIWQTEVDDGSFALIEMKPCGKATCGWMLKSYYDTGAEYQSENIGKQLVIDMVNQGNGQYEGQVWRPSNNKVYIGKMEINGDSLRLKGCVAGGLLCSSQTWKRLQ